MILKLAAKLAEHAEIIGLCALCELRG